MLLTCGDNEERAEVYGCAADRNQASIVFNVAADMVRMCPALSKRVKILTLRSVLSISPQVASIKCFLLMSVTSTVSILTAWCSTNSHTQPNRKLYDVMTKGSGDARMQPLYFLITTAGDNQNSICWEVHQKALDLINGRKHDHTFYPIIYGATPDEDWTDPKVWKSESLPLSE